MSVANTNPTDQNRSLAATASGALSNVGVMMRQPAIQRAMPAIMIVGMLVVGFLAWALLSEPSRTALYPGMAENDKSQVVETLRATGIDVTIDNGTGDVMVASKDYYSARMALASAGLPQSVPTGGDMITDLPMGASRSVEGARLRQAQEYDLARSISEIGIVQGARVHLALPERSAFLRDTAPPRASVFLQLAAGRSLDRGQVDAIVNLVSSSVPGMARQDVTVVDQMGRLLSRGADETGLMLSDRELEHRVQLEGLYRNRIESLLAPVVGPDNMSVQVTVEMDFTRMETTSEMLDPNGSVVLSEQESLSETSEGQARGIPGAVSNAPPPAAELNTLADGEETTATETTGPTNRSTSTTRNYEVSRTVTATQAPGARVVRISAAVLVHAEPAAEGEEGAAGPDLTSLEQLARSAIGFNAERGDSVTVMAQSFQPMEIASGSPIKSVTWLPDVLRQVAIVVALAVIGLGVVRPILDRVLVPANTAIEAAQPMGSTAIEVGEGESLTDVQKRLNSRRMELAEAAIGGDVSRDEKFEVMRQLAAEDPARIASVLHRMMSDEIDQVS
ncbi:flagellar M-ring protein FliF [Marivivens niveibacter]|uniref:Flagellar M-ring protein n=1 Tax=Marivivens niveibacter TaxID=1930667 RepID=A0A251X0C1_9RHOB|nr:flagellar basal-body MS-ring/collar protein FliF [Marivivens niveibacter]OUD10190.1 flagellar M-ring protein FliF [Marivivens niveibacter]